jgi:murein DD-endopeptidase MepM/ murein hydrolase activator NlpD
MFKPSCLLLLSLLLPTPALAVPKLEFNPVLDNQASCQSGVLSNLQRHRVQPGETVANIAQQYNLIPETLLNFNSQGAIPGTELLIPPFNGRRIQVPGGTTWSDLAKQYGMRADVLFELNGCQPRPVTAFIPGVNQTASSPENINRYTGLASYPLPNPSQVALSYGWYVHPQHQERIFHSGIDLLAAKGTAVQATAGGTVAFAAEQGNYGKLVVINHPSGLQTRYAHLDTIQVRSGQEVRQGEKLGTVGTTGQPDLTQSHLHFEVRYNSALGWVAQDPSVHLRNR